MAAIGVINELEIVKEVDFGLYLDGEEHGEILLPKRYVPAEYEIGQTIEVFIYLDSEDRIIATTEKPLAMVEDFAVLEVAAVNRVGAFLKWGLMKDLFVPFREQKVKMEEGKKYLVYVYLDEESNRIVASSKIDQFVDNLPLDYEPGEEVSLIIAEQTDLGFKAIIDKCHFGMLYKNEVFQELHIGQKINGYINKLREDEKIDLILQPIGYEKVEGLSKEIFDKLKANKGFLAVNDKSSPETIYSIFQISKKNFKKAVGSLYKQRLISIDEDGIRLV